MDLHEQDTRSVDVAQSIHPVQRAERGRRVQQRAQQLRAELDDLADNGAHVDDLERMRLRLEGLGRRLDAAAVELDALKQVRDAYLVEASEAHGLPRRYVALATFMTPGRVQQILDRATACPGCGNAVTPAATGQLRPHPELTADRTWHPAVQTATCEVCGAQLARNVGTGYEWRRAG